MTANKPEREAIETLEMVRRLRHKVISITEPQSEPMPTKYCTQHGQQLSGQSVAPHRIPTLRVPDTGSAIAVSWFMAVLLSRCRRAKVPSNPRTRLRTNYPKFSKSPSKTQQNESSQKSGGDDSDDIASTNGHFSPQSKGLRT